MTPEQRADQARLQEFLDLVDCKPSEVKDIPAGRPLAIEEVRAECARVDPEARRKSLGQMQVYFGMHKGKRLQDVPLGYLKWIVSVKPTNGSFRRFQNKVRQYLGRDIRPGNEPERGSPLTQKVLAIVKNS